MDYQIDRKGKLLIERSGKLEPQMCPSSNSVFNKVRCGDWCPMFGEVRYVEAYDYHELSLCKSTLRGSCKDLREE